MSYVHFYIIILLYCWDIYYICVLVIHLTLLYCSRSYKPAAAEKERKKQKEREKKERQKKEGTYMTKKQKQQAALAQQRLEAMRAAGMEVSVVLFAFII